MEAIPKGNAVRVLMIGDVVGKPGREVVARRLPAIRERLEIDFVVANAENVAGGSGITPEIYNALLEVGVDCITLGDHAFRMKSIYTILNSPDSRAIRPANFPAEAPGRGVVVLEAASSGSRPAVRVGVVSLLGRVFISQPVDNPFASADKALDRIKETKIRIVDFHAEATSESQAMGRYLDGRVSAVLGTHTHVATADELILPFGTAYQTDVGMTGPFDSVIGRRVEPVVDNFRTGRPASFDVATGDARISGAIVDVDASTGKALGIYRYQYREDADAL